MENLEDWLFSLPIEEQAIIKQAYEDSTCNFWMPIHVPEQAAFLAGVKTGKDLNEPK